MNNDESITIIRGKNPSYRNDQLTTSVIPKKTFPAVSKKLDSDEPPKPHVTTLDMVKAIQSARSKLSWTQDDLAKHSNLHKGVVQKYEVPNTIIVVEELRKITNALHLPQFSLSK